MGLEALEKTKDKKLQGYLKRLFPKINIAY
jgi:hypothetical protein